MLPVWVHRSIHRIAKGVAHLLLDYSLLFGHSHFHFVSACHLLAFGQLCSNLVRAHLVRCVAKQQRSLLASSDVHRLGSSDFLAVPLEFQPVAVSFLVGCGIVEHINSHLVFVVHHTLLRGDGICYHKVFGLCHGNVESVLLVGVHVNRVHRFEVVAQLSCAYAVLAVILEYRHVILTLGIGCGVIFHSVV